MWLFFTKHLQSSRMAWEYRHARALLLHHYCILNTILCIYRLVIHKRKSFGDKYHMIYGIWINSIQMFCLFSLDSYNMKANINSVLFANWTNCLSLEFLQCFFFVDNLCFGGQQLKNNVKPLPNHYQTYFWNEICFQQFQFHHAQERERKKRNCFCHYSLFRFAFFNKTISYDLKY